MNESDEEDARGQVETLGALAQHGSGLGTVYRALDELLAELDLEHAALVVDVPGFGRQVLNAGRKPMRDDDRGLLTKGPGLYLDPDRGDDDAPGVDPLVAELMLAVGSLALRHDSRGLAGPEAAAEEGES